MQKLTEGMLLYHGSYTEISAIDLKYSKRTLDFGKGFYLTSSYEQALNYIPSAVKKNIRWRKLPADFKVEDGCISVFGFIQHQSCWYTILKQPILIGFILFRQIETIHCFNLS